MSIEPPEFIPTKYYTFEHLRSTMGYLPKGPGAVSYLDWKVQQTGAGANMEVEVRGGDIWIQGLKNTRQGLYHIYKTGAEPVGTTITASTAGKVRVDQVVAIVNDSSVTGPTDTPQIVIVKGTEVATSQIRTPQAANYREGAATTGEIEAAYPNASGYMKLADIYITNATTKLETGKNIVDTRLFANTARVSIATEQAVTTTSFLSMETPDMAEVTVPEGGLVVMGYQALVKESVTGAGRAAIFIGSNQIQTSSADNRSLAQETSFGSGTHTAEQFMPLATWPQGLNSQNNAYELTTFPSTGYAIGAPSGGGLCSIMITSAGTYRIGVQFKSSSGSVTVKQRHLWVWVQ